MMKKHLLATLGLVILTGCAAASNPAKLSTEPVTAVPQQETAQSSQAPTLEIPVQSAAPAAVGTRQELFISSKPFLAENLKKPGVKQLPGGVQYRVINSGAGASPTLEDTVDINFTATRVDGTVISSTTTGTNPKPRSYQLKKTLPELRRVLLKMQPGDKWEVVIPPSNKNILTDSGGALIYDLELVAVHSAAGKSN